MGFLGTIRPHDFIYASFFWAAAIAGIISLTIEFRKRGIPRIDGPILALVGALGGRFGALLMFSWEHDRWSTDWRTYASFGMRWGSTQYGAIYGGFLILFAYAKLRKIGFVRLMDIACPTITLAFVVGRLGCYAANCCPGVFLPPGWALPAFLPYPEYFPASLVTAGVLLGIYRFLYTYPVDDAHRGMRAGWYLALTALERFFIEFLRQSDQVWWWLTLVQAMAIPLFILGVAMINQWPCKIVHAAQRGLARGRADIRS